MHDLQCALFSSSVWPACGCASIVYYLAVTFITIYDVSVMFCLHADLSACPQFFFLPTFAMSLPMDHFNHNYYCLTYTHARTYN